MEPVRGAGAGVVSGQALAQAVGLNAHNRVRVLIEGSSAMEDFHSNGVFLDLVELPGKALLAQIRQQMSERGRARESLGMKHRLQFRALGCEIGRLCAFHRHPLHPHPYSD